jgi:type IV pilus assembly protein PilY1
VIDLSGDGYADRMYAADLGGRVWRFDIFNGQSLTPGGDEPRFVEGGLLADVLLREDGTRDTSNPMRFFYSPDPALVELEGTTFINVAIGSGHRELPVTDAPPNSPYTTNWFFGIRDQNAYRQLRSDEYALTCSTSPCQQTVTFDDLVDLTSIVDPVTAAAAVPLVDTECPDTGCELDDPPRYIPGWKIRMETPGEKVLSESRTFQGNVYFTTYAPANRGLTNTGCATAIGSNRLYIVSAISAAAVNDLNNDGVVSEGERSRELGQQFTIAPEVVFIFPGTEGPLTECIGDDCRPNPICLVGLESCGPGFLNAPVRTFWQQRGVE